MKQNNSRELNKTTNSRFSKIVIVIVGAVIALIAFVVGGTLAGWDILGWLKSPTAILIYLIIFAVAATFVFVRTRTRRY